MDGGAAAIRVEWENPLPQGGALGAVWASSADDAWAVGDSGMVLHWDGRAWRIVPTLTQRRLTTVWGTSASDVWIAGERGLTLHWDGRGWTAPPVCGAGTVTALSGTSGGDVWATEYFHDRIGPNSSSALWHWDGAAWTVASDDTPPVDSLWAASPCEVWALSFWGPGNEVRRFDGTAWRPIGEGGPRSSLLSAFGGSSDHDVWVGAIGTPFFWRWDGAAWSTVTTPLVGRVSDIAVRSPTEAWAAGRIAATGSTGGLLRWDGAAWSMAVPRVNLDAVAVTTDGHVFAAGGATLLWGDGASWSVLPSGTRANLWATWSGAEDDAWAVGDTILHWDGRAWTQASVGADLVFNDVWGCSTTDVWAVGQKGAATWPLPGIVAHWDGTRWEEVPLSDPASQLHAVWGDCSARGEVWAAGWESLVRWDGRSWRTFAGAPRAGLRDVWGTGPSDVWVVGNYHDFDSAVWHWDGSVWTTMLSAASGYATTTFTSVSGTAPDDVSIVDVTTAYRYGTFATLHHWDGTSWGRAVFPGDAEEIAVLSPDDAWAWGPLGVWHRDAGGWTALGPDLIADVRGLPGGTVRAVGPGGIIVRYVR